MKEQQTAVLETSTSPPASHRTGQWPVWPGFCLTVRGQKETEQLYIGPESVTVPFGLPLRNDINKYLTFIGSKGTGKK